MILYRQPARDDGEAILDLVAEAFDHELAREPAVRSAVLDDPDYHPEVSLVAVDEHRLLAYLATQRTAVSLAGRWLPVGRLGTVCTSPAARRRGIGRQLVEQACGLLGDLGAVILNPAADAYVTTFYESMGFVAARRTRSAYRVEGSRVPAAPASFRPRPAAREDIEALDQLYEWHYGPQPGSLRRTPAWWLRRVTNRPMLWSTLVPSVRVVGDVGRPIAYAVTAPDDGFRVWEWAAAPGAESAALALLAEIATASGPFFTIHISRFDPLWPCLRPLQPADATPEPGPVMVRAGNLELLQPVLEEIVADGGGALEVTADGPRVLADEAVLGCSWSQLLALAYDGRDLVPWSDDGLVSIEPDTDSARAALAVVLPPLVAGRRPTDAF